MIRNALLVVAVATCTLLIETTAAVAADPSKIGERAEKMILPNVESIWLIGAVCAAAIMIFGRPKGSMIAAMVISLVLSGAIIFNPAGFSDTVQTIGNKLL